MRFLDLISAMLATTSALAMALEDASWWRSRTPERRSTGIAPRVFIISMFSPEAEVWHGIRGFNLLANNITVPGFAPRFPDAHCLPDYSVCQLVTDEGEINAAATMTALMFSPTFDLRKTYFLIAGIVGVNPHVTSLASVTFARYEIQCALQYEFDTRDIPSNFTTGYLPQGSYSPDLYPSSIYGTEVFELNAALRENVMGLVHAANISLADNEVSRQYRARFLPGGRALVNATLPPSVTACDGVTSDTYFAGTRLTEAFANYTRLVTNGTGTFCGSGQEDSATFEALVRGARAGKVDFGRVIAMRTASDYTMPPPGISAYQNLRYTPMAGFNASVANIRIAGMPIIRGILDGWQRTYERGIAPKNYIGDILGSLNGSIPRDFGPANPMAKRGEGQAVDAREYRAMGFRERRRSMGRRQLPRMQILY